MPSPATRTARGPSLAAAAALCRATAAATTTTMAGAATPADGRLLSFAIMGTTFLFRIPQAFKVWRAQSVVGLNPLAFEVEMYGYALCVLNGFRRGLPVELWGEHISSCTQSMLLVAMIYAYPGAAPPPSSQRKWLNAIGIGATYTLGLSGLLPSAVIYRLYDLQNAAVALSRLAQARTNYKRGGTGQLSLTTRAAMVFGNSVRVYTTVRNKAGASMLFGHSSSALANFVLLAQCVWYYRKPPERFDLHAPAAVTPLVARQVRRFRNQPGMDSDEESQQAVGMAPSGD
jgi:hypothetical protein